MYYEFLERNRLSTKLNKHDNSLEAILNKKAGEKHLKIVPVPGDGNCMFHAISHQLNHILGLTVSHEELRRMIVDYLRNHPQTV